MGAFSDPPLGIPAGLIVMWHGLIANIPVGWLLCDGTDSTPDLRAKFVRGAPDATEAGDLGGADTHTLTENEMPVHLHSQMKDPSNLGGGLRSLNGETNSYSGAGTVYTDETGGDAAHNNMPAYYEVLYIMKT